MHALELDPVHHVEQPGGDRERRVLRVAAGGERVGRGVVDDVEPRLREPGRDAQALDQVVVAAVLGLVGGLGPAGRDRDLVGVVVRAPRQRHGDDEGDDDADPAAAEEQHDGRRRQRDDDDEAEQHQERAALVAPRSARSRDATCLGTGSVARVLAGRVAIGADQRGARTGPAASRCLRERRRRTRASRS